MSQICNVADVARTLIYDVIINKYSLSRNAFFLVRLSSEEAKGLSPDLYQQSLEEEEEEEDAVSGGRRWHTPYLLRDGCGSAASS